METLLIIMLFAGGMAVQYIIIKYAVKNAILEIRSDDKEDSASPKNQISQIACKECGKIYDMDFPKCPQCGGSPDQ